METETLREHGFIGYELIGDTYYMKDFASGEILNTMQEVAILFDGEVLLKHGHPDKIKQHMDRLKLLWDSALPGLGYSLHILQGKIPIDKLDKILSITGYLPEEKLKIIMQMDNKKDAS